MEDNWEKKLACANQCQHCNRTLGKKDPRMLSVYTHEPICIDCKQTEERRPDFQDQSKQMIASCISTTGKPYGDLASYCFHHFCPFKCKD
jgi:hypothetical protein